MHTTHNSLVEKAFCLQSNLTPTAPTTISKPMAQIRHILPFQSRVAFADKGHIAVSLLGDKINFLLYL